VEEMLFPLPIVPRAFYFSIIAIFIGTPSGSLCRGESSCLMTPVMIASQEA